MKSKPLFILVLIAGLSLSGCASVATLEDENRALRSQVESMDNQIVTLSSQVYDIRNTQEETQKKLTALEQKLASFSAVEQAKPVATKPGPPRVKSATVKLKTPNVKVLTGSGGLISARKMARRLKNMGCKVNKIGYAPKRFSKNTVFYARGFRNEAKGIVGRLGGETIAKPLTWQSIFDIIVVTGK